MHITDPVADMLTRIRNANNAKHETVDVPASNMKKSIAQILLDEGYIKTFQVVDDGTQGVIRITLKYNAGKEKVISGLRRVSQARPARLCRRRRAAPRAAWPWHCHRFHVQGRHDRQGCSRGSRRRRSPGIRLVRRVFEQCLELVECPLPSPPAWKSPSPRATSSPSRAPRAP